MIACVAPYKGNVLTEEISLLYSVLPVKIPSTILFGEHSENDGVDSPVVCAVALID